MYIINNTLGQLGRTTSTGPVNVKNNKPIILNSVFFIRITQSYTFRICVSATYNGASLAYGGSSDNRTYVMRMA